MGKPAISYAPRDDATAEAEIATLANVYKFILEAKLAKKRGRVPDKSGPVDARERIKDARTQGQYTR